MWRCDAERSASTSEALPEDLRLQWTQRYPARIPVWEDPLNRDLMPYDRIFEPVAADGRLFIGFNDSDKIVALDAATGEELWRFCADGPVRLPGAVFEDRVFFVSDDGNLYCLATADGKLLWRFEGAPKLRRILGNGRLISSWPARGGPVVADGIVYFAAGIWPFMGTFIYAIDAATGRVVWINDGDGPTFQQHPHGGAFSFGGVAPQGALVASGERLLVPGGRSVPAVLDRKTGAVLHYRFGDNNKTGGAFVCARNGVFFNHYREGIVSLYDIEKGDALAGQLGGAPVMADDVFCLSGHSVRALDAAAVVKDPEQWKQATLWEEDIDASGDLIQAGSRLYAAGKDGITVLRLKKNDKPETETVVPVGGEVARLVASEDRLFAVTLDGRILAFGGNGKNGKDGKNERESSSSRAGIEDDYPLSIVYGAGDGSYVDNLAKTSDARIVVFDPNPDRVAELRRRFDDAGFYGHRIAVHVGTPETSATPPYVAASTVLNEVQGAVDAALIENVYRSMRPYGGIARIEGATRETIAAAMAKAKVPGLTLRDDGVLVREGPIEGAGTWTHILADAAQSGMGRDERVRLPLGLLWFGGNSHVDVLPRHGHGPPEQVLGGRLFIEGIDCLSARDVYTGRILWKRGLTEFDTFGVYYNETYKDTPTSTAYNQVHIPGANGRGTNFLATQDAVYVIQGRACLALDPSSGETRKSLVLPGDGGEGPAWVYVGALDDTLIAGAEFVAYRDLLLLSKKEQSPNSDFDFSSSKRLFALDRSTDGVLWQTSAQFGFPNYGIVAGNGTVFLLDTMPPFVQDYLERRGKRPPGESSLRACDVRTGQERWATRQDVFGSFLCYSVEHDILLQATRPSRDDMEGEEGKRIVAYRGKDGRVLWDRAIDYPTFPLLHGDRFVTEAGVFDLETGDPATIPNPMTGTPMPWVWRRTHGCNYPVASVHLLTFRSGAAGFYDWANTGGSGNFGGFRSGCSSNLIAADGVLNAPDYTRTCSCSYQNQTSLAFVHDPDVEFWTFNEFGGDDAPVRTLAINLGAPGDRRLDDGTLWLEYPIVGGPSPKLDIAVEPAEGARWFRHHSSRYRGDGLRWVAASGVEGAVTLRVRLANDGAAARPYAIRLHFAEPDDTPPDKRRFDVALDGKPMLRALDVVAESGAPRTTLVKSFDKVALASELTIALTPADGSELPPILCGIEAHAEGG